MNILDTRSINVCHRIGMSIALDKINNPESNPVISELELTEEDYELACVRLGRGETLKDGEKNCIRDGFTRAVSLTLEAGEEKGFGNILPGIEPNRPVRTLRNFIR